MTFVTFKTQRNAGKNEVKLSNYSNLYFNLRVETLNYDLINKIGKYGFKTNIAILYSCSNYATYVQSPGKLDGSPKETLLYKKTKMAQCLWIRFETINSPIDWFI